MIRAKKFLLKKSVSQADGLGGFNFTWVDICFLWARVKSSVRRADNSSFGYGQRVSEIIICDLGMDEISVGMVLEDENGWHDVIQVKTNPDNETVVTISQREQAHV